MNLKEILVALVIYLLQRIPFLRDLPIIRDAGTIDGAIRFLQTAAGKLAKVAAARAAEAERAAEVAKAAQVTKTNALADKARAEKLAAKLVDFTA